MALKTIKVKHRLADLQPGDTFYLSGDSTVYTVASSFLGAYYGQYGRKNLSENCEVEPAGKIQAGARRRAYFSKLAKKHGLTVAQLSHHYRELVIKTTRPLYSREPIPATTNDTETRATQALRESGLVYSVSVPIEPGKFGSKVIEIVSGDYPSRLFL